MVVRSLLALLGFLASAAQAAEPLITTDILYGTYDLLNDLHGLAWTKVPMEPSWARWKDMQEQISKQVGPLPPAVEDARAQAMVAMVQVRALVLEFSAKAYGPANEVAVQIVQTLEGILPASKGLIRKSLGDLVVSVCYFGLVAYILLKVLLFALRTVACIFCGICCCGFCCRRKKDPATKAKAAKKAAAKPSAAKPAAAKPVLAKTNGKKK